MMKTIVSMLSVVLVVSVLARVAIAGQGYTFTTIDVPVAITVSVEDINDRQEMVGYYEEASESHAFLLDKHGTFTTLDFPGVARTVAFGNNQAGQIVGMFQGPEGRSHGLFYDHIMLMVPDPPDTQPHTWATDINDSLQMVGVVHTLTGRHGFLYADSEFTPIDVPFPGASDTQMEGLNNLGAMVGHYVTPTGPRAGFLRQPDGTFLSIQVPFPGAFDTRVNAVNDQGVIVGEYTDQTGTHGFVYDQGTYTTIGVPGSVGTRITGINSHGWLVGTFIEAPNITRGFVAK
jgi:uncharacterized membrane protein